MSDFQLPINFQFFNSIFSVRNMQIVTIFATGLQAGQSYNLNIYTLPHLRKIYPRSKQIQLYISMNYKEQIKSWINLLLCSSLIYSLHKKTNNNNFYIPLAFLWAKIPITFGFMKIDWESRAQQDSEKMDKFLSKWKQGHWVRIVGDVCAFATITFLAIYHKKQFKLKIT